MCPALYLIEPTAASVDIICNEFSNLAEPQYSCAYIACINAIDPDLRKRLTSIKRVEQVVTFPLDFHTIEKRVFTLNDPNGFSTLHSYDTELNENDPKGSKETDEEKTARKEKEKEAKENSIRQIGKSLASFCYCLGINPAIRYINRPDSELTQGIVESLRSGHDDILQSIEVGSYNPDRRKAKKLNILIMDRTSDLVTPLLTEFTYQAMCIDVLPILFNNITIQNKGQEKVVNLEEDDSFWNDIRHKHIANASPYVVSGFNSFMASHKGIVGKKGAADMEQMGEMMKQLPEYMDLMTKFSNHMALITMCFDKMKELNLDSIAAIEQNMATGVDSKGAEVKNVLSWVTPIIGNQSTKTQYKIRLLLLFFFTQDFKENEKKKLMDMVRLDDNDKKIVNLALTLPKVLREKFKPQKKKKGEKEDETFTLSRYVPYIKELVLRMVKNDVPDYCVLYDTNVAGYDHGLKQNQGNITVGGGSSLKKKATQNKDNEALCTTKKEKVNEETLLGEDKDILVIFITGCISYSEMRVAYELSDSLKMNVFIGSNTIAKPNDYIKVIGSLCNDSLKKCSSLDELERAEKVDK